MKPPSIVKFKVELVAPDVPGDERVDQLRRWCLRFNELGLTPQIPGQGRTQGNLSFRLRPGEPAFVITGSTLSTKGALAPGDFVTVLRSDLEREDRLRLRHARPVERKHAALRDLPAQARRGGHLPRPRPADHRPGRLARPAGNRERKNRPGPSSCSSK